MRRDKEQARPQDDGKDGGEEDLAERFPDVERDERLKVSRVELPEAPRASFQRPITEAAGTKPQKYGAVADLRGAGVGYMIGIALVSSILIGTGLGWAVDTFLLHNKGTPWGLILGFLAGTVNGFVQLIQITNRLNADEERRSSQGKGR